MYCEKLQNMYVHYDTYISDLYLNTPPSIKNLKTVLVDLSLC